jgi:nitric oxide synthase-interacting protein
MSNLLAQRKEIKRLEKAAERIKEDESEAKKREDELARERAVREFEAVQMGLEVKLGAGGRVVGREGGKVVVERDELEKDEKSGNSGRGVKRKFVVDEEELKRIAEEETSKARRTLEDERRAKPHLPSFWVPSETPDVNHATGPPPKHNPTCPSSDPAKPHALSLKSLTSVHFTEEKSSDTGKPVRTCPSCRKALSNSTKAVLAIPCGHVLCKPCVDKFLTPHHRHHRDAHEETPAPETVHCYVCDADLTAAEPKQVEKEGKKRKKDKETGPKPGLVELKTEGTGFAGGGKNMVKKEGTAFQV